MRGFTSSVTQVNLKISLQDIMFRITEQTNSLVLGEPDARGAQATCEGEEELLREAIALSLEENNEEGKEEDEEVELLKQAIALSLEAGHER